MMKWKKPVGIAAAITAIIAASPLILKAIFVIYCVVAWFFVWLFTNLMPSPEVPQIKHGEFPFRLVYEIEGEQREIADTLIFDYNGVEGTINGKLRKWKMNSASGNATKRQRYLFLTTVYHGGIIPNIDRTIEWVDLYVELGYPEYYMGLLSKEEYENETHPPKLSFYGACIGENGDELGELYLDEDDLFEQYRIKIISWEIAKPLDYQFNDLDAQGDGSVVLP